MTATVSRAPTDVSTDRPASRHGPIAQLLMAWSPLSVILVAYWLAQWVAAPLAHSDTNRVGASLHVAGPALADERIFGGLPTVWLQQHLADGPARWYDAAAAVIYVTHFLVIPVLTSVVWFGLRKRFGTWLIALLAMTVVGMAGYVLYPAAPPWMAYEMGGIDPVDRISHIGWGYLHLDAIGSLTLAGQGGSNPVAAMPSLHAGAALLVVLFLWPSVGRAARTALTAYALAMALVLVYTGEHYVVDVVAGWLVAVVATLISRAASGPMSRWATAWAGGPGVRPAGEGTCPDGARGPARGLPAGAPAGLTTGLPTGPAPGLAGGGDHLPPRSGEGAACEG